MFAILAPLVAQFGVQILGSLIGQAAASGDREQERALREAAMNEFNIPAPHLEQMVAQAQGDTALAGIQNDPSLRGAQMGAIDAFGRVANANGLDPQARAMQEEAEGSAAQYERGQREALVSGARRRGVGGSGVDLASQLQAQQSGADRAHAGDVNAAASGAQRALDAWGQQLAAASGVRAQDRGEAEGVARARDEIARFNIQNGQDVHRYNNEVAQQGFGNRFDLAGARAHAQLGQADSLGRSADRTAQMWGGVGQGAGQAIGAANDAGVFGGQKRTPYRSRY